MYLSAQHKPKKTDSQSREESRGPDGHNNYHQKMIELKIYGKFVFWGKKKHLI
jgi:hypothetical protein